MRVADGAAWPESTGGSFAADSSVSLAEADRGAGDPDCPQCAGIGFVRRSVEFGHPDFGRAIACVCVLTEHDDERQSRLERFSNLGSLVRQTFSTLLPRGRSPEPAHQERFSRAVADAQRFAGDPHGFLVFIGESGTGKTHLAAAISNQCIEQGLPVFFAVVPDLLDHLRAAYGPSSEIPYDRLFEVVRTAPLLVLDALGAQFSTPWAEEKLFQVLNYRYNSQLATVFTCSMALDELDERIRTRITDPTVSRIHVLEDGPGRQRGMPDPLMLPLLRGMTFATFNHKPAPPQISEKVARNLQNIYMTARNFAEHPEGWLVLLGETGSGKTHLAAAIAHQVTEQRQQAHFVVVPDLLEHLRNAMHADESGRRDAIDEVRTAPLLVLDDLGVHSATPWAQEKLFQILNYRYNAKLATVITMSCSLDDLPQSWVSRMYDDKVSMILEIQAPDYRGLQRGRKPDAVRRARR